MYTIHLDTVDSTNTYAKAHAGEFPQHQISCVYAEEQTAGRGRERKIWISPKGLNLYVTFFCTLPPNAPHLTSIGQVLALSCASVLLKYGLSPGLKWPNDIQLQGKKIAGILCETIFHPSLAHLFLGIGVNVNMDQSLLTQIDQPATSLSEETGHSWDKKLLLQKIQMQFSLDFQRFKEEGFTPFHSLFDHLLASKGQTISCSDGHNTWTGICHSISPDGRLNLLLPDQSIKTLSSGNIQ